MAASDASPQTKRSSRLRDPEFAAKHKAFLQKVSTAEHGTMESFLQQEAKAPSPAAVSPVPSLKRRLGPAAASPAQTVVDPPAVAAAAAEAPPAKRKRRRSRTSSTGQVRSNSRRV